MRKVRITYKNIQTFSVDIKIADLAEVSSGALNLIRIAVIKQWSNSYCQKVFRERRVTCDNVPQNRLISVLKPDSFSADEKVNIVSVIRIRKRAKLGNQAAFIIRYFCTYPEGLRIALKILPTEIVNSGFRRGYRVG